MCVCVCVCVCCFFTLAPFSRSWKGRNIQCVVVVSSFDCESSESLLHLSKNWYLLFNGVTCFILDFLSFFLFNGATLVFVAVFSWRSHRIMNCPVSLGRSLNDHDEHLLCLFLGIWKYKCHACCGCCFVCQTFLWTVGFLMVFLWCWRI